MKTKHLIQSVAILMIASSLVLSGCRKKDDDKDDDTTGAAENSLAEQSFNDMNQISDEGSKGSLNNYKSAEYDGLLAVCASVTHDTANKKIMIDFGSTNCLCKDNRYRRGKLFVSYTLGAHGFGYWDSLCSITITTTDPSTQANTYFVNDHQVIGTRNVTNNGRNSAGHLNWSVTENGQIIKPNGQGTITWNANRNREWSAGEGTLTWLDDAYSISGSANGVHANGNSFTMTITSPLVKKMNCWWIVSGKFDYTPGSKPTRHVDFSAPNNGACDDIATVTINSKTYTVHMK